MLVALLLLFLLAQLGPELFLLESLLGLLLLAQPGLLVPAGSPTLVLDALLALILDALLWLLLERLWLLLLPHLASGLVLLDPLGLVLGPLSLLALLLRLHLLLTLSGCSATADELPALSVLGHLV